MPCGRTRSDACPEQLRNGNRLEEAGPEGGGGHHPDPGCSGISCQVPNAKIQDARARLGGRRHVHRTRDLVRGQTPWRVPARLGRPGWNGEQRDRGGRGRPARRTRGAGRPPPRVPATVTSRENGLDWREVGAPEVGQKRRLPERERRTLAPQAGANRPFVMIPDSTQDGTRPVRRAISSWPATTGRSATAASEYSPPGPSCCESTST